MKNIFIVSVVFAVMVAACGDGVEKHQNGEQCTKDSECDSGKCSLGLFGCNPFFGCTTYELPGGMCTTNCNWFTEGTPDELRQSNCTDGEVCLAFGDSEKICFQSCEMDEDCREDYLCTDLGGYSSCLPPPSTKKIIKKSSVISSAQRTEELE